MPALSDKASSSTRARFATRKYLVASSIRRRQAGGEKWKRILRTPLFVRSAVHRAKGTTAQIVAHHWHPTRSPSRKKYDRRSPRHSLPLSDSPRRSGSRGSHRSSFCGVASRGSLRSASYLFRSRTYGAWQTEVRRRSHARSIAWRSPSP